MPTSPKRHKHEHILTDEQVERICSRYPSAPPRSLSPEHRAKLAAGLARWRAAKSQPPQPVETAQVWEGREFR